MCSKTRRAISAALLYLATNSVSAEGIIDLKPHVGLNTTYDDNVFRFSSKEEAKRASGSSTTSDTILRAEVGLNVNLRLSRQLFSFTSNISDNKYNRFNQLDNIGKSYGLKWSWRLGNDLFGELGAEENKSIAGFDELRSTSKNNRTYKRQFVSANWQFHPGWTVLVDRSATQSENGSDNFNSLDRDSDVSEIGLQYASQLGTQLGLAFRDTKSRYPNRAGFSRIFFGNENIQEEVILNAACWPSAKTRFSGYVSHFNLDYKDAFRDSISGFSERFNIDYLATAKTAVNLSLYKEISAVDDIVSTYVEIRGFEINPSWTASDKLKLSVGLGYEKRDYLGDAGLLVVSADSRFDESKNVNLSLAYAPTLKSHVQLAYLGERRTSNQQGQGYDVNILSMSLQYNF